MKTNLTILFFAVMSVASCKKDNNTDSNVVSIEGKFAISLSPITKSLKLEKANESVGFDLDTLKSSKTFYFTLSNIGEEDITNVKINSDNNSFAPSPSTIQILQGKKNSNSLSQAFALEVTHGIRINGVGYADRMKMGDNLCNLTISGQTTDGKKTISTELIVPIKVFAKVMDIVLLYGTDTIDFSKFSYCGTVLFPDSCKNCGLDKLRMYNYNTVIKIVNTGNVPLKISLFSNDDPTTTQPDYHTYFVLNTGATSTNLSLPLCSGSNYSYIYGVSIKSDGTISDPSRLEIGNDGNSYFALNSLCP